jgi:hypothetical protein
MSIPLRDGLSRTSNESSPAGGEDTAEKGTILRTTFRTASEGMMRYMHIGLILLVGAERAGTARKANRVD